MRFISEESLVSELTSALPVGSDLKKVDAYLKKLGFVLSEVSRDDKVFAVTSHRNMTAITALEEVSGVTMPDKKTGNLKQENPMDFLTYELTEICDLISCRNIYVYIPHTENKLMDIPKVSINVTYL